MELYPMRNLLLAAAATFVFATAAIAGEACEYEGASYPDESTWEVGGDVGEGDCMSCSCQNGVASCDECYSDW